LRRFRLPDGNKSYERRNFVGTLSEGDDLWAFEYDLEWTSILTTYTRTGALLREQGTKLLADTETLLSPLPSVSHQEAYETATEFGISAYDARFITLARQMKSKLVTEDAKLRKAVPDWTVSLSETLA
jgi:hypothetical protein